MSYNNNGIPLQLTIARVGKLNTILYASKFLVHRLSSHIAARKNMGMENIFPSLTEVKTTHYCTISTAFKPTVVCAFNYSCHNACDFQLGKEVTFDPSFNCDYINDGYIRWALPEVTCTAADLPNIIVKPFDSTVSAANGNLFLDFGLGQLSVNGTPNFFNGFNYIMLANVPQPTPTIYGTNNYIIHPSATNFVPGVGGISYLYTDKFGTFIAGPDGTLAAPTVEGFGGGQNQPKVQRANAVKCAEYLGSRLTNRVLLQIDQNEITSYNSFFSINKIERCFQRGMQLEAYLRLIGQEVPYDCIKDKQYYANTNIPGLGLDPEVFGHHREYTKVSFDGHQTPSPVKKATHIMTPLHFWFNETRTNPLPILCMPEVDFYIKVCTPCLDKLFYPAEGDTYIQETVHLTAQGVNANTYVNPHVELQRRVPFLIPNSKVQADNNCCLSATLYLCNLYLEDQIHDILLHRISLILIRLSRESCMKINDTDCDKQHQVNNCRWPVEYTFIRDIPFENQDDTKNTTAEWWWRCGHQLKIEDHSNYRSVIFPRVNPLDTDSAIFIKQIDHLHPDYITRTTPAIKQLGVSIYDSSFYNKMHDYFYRNYIPYAYCNGYIHSNDVPLHSLMFTFANKPGFFNPNGHVNVTKTRAMVFELEAILGEKLLVNLFIQHNVINFVLISDGSMYIRFQ